MKKNKYKKKEHPSHLVVISLLSLHGVNNGGIHAYYYKDINSIKKAIPINELKDNQKTPFDSYLLPIYEKIINLSIEFPEIDNDVINIFFKLFVYMTRQDYLHSILLFDIIGSKIEEIISMKYEAISKKTYNAFKVIHYCGVESAILKHKISHLHKIRISPIFDFIKDESFIYKSLIETNKKLGIKASKTVYNELQSLFNKCYIGGEKNDKIKYFKLERESPQKSVKD